VSTSPYQILPDLLPQEYEALKASIAERGVDIPIIVDNKGNIIDGFHRQRACDELGIFCPQEVRQFATEAEKYGLVLRSNCRRRQLNRKQKEKLIEVYLLRDPQIADNSLGDLIGVSKNTVAKVRTHLVATRQIDKFEKLRGRDGKERPSKYKRIIANTPKEAETALAVIGDLPENCNGKMLDVTTAKRRARRNRKHIETEKTAAEPFGDDAIRIYHCPFQQLEQMAGLAPASVQLVCTDIPYGQEFLPQLEELAALAKRALAPGGLFVSYLGQFRLDEKLSAIGKHLKYQWLCSSVWVKQASFVPHLKMVSKSIPMVVCSNGEWQPSRKWCDTFHVEGREKDWHEWQRPLEEVERIVEYFSKPGDLVVDPCGGGFTTAIACHHLGRRFIGCDIDKAAVASGQERLDTADVSVVEDRQEEFLTELKNWIEDANESQYPQQYVRRLWKTCIGLSSEQLGGYLKLLTESHLSMWNSLPKTLKSA
jgi:site-specific DNA-methyltransferase (adenine-specific)